MPCGLGRRFEGYQFAFAFLLLRARKERIKLINYSTQRIFDRGRGVL
jgi:hypothetical protein